MRQKILFTLVLLLGCFSIVTLSGQDFLKVGNKWLYENGSFLGPTFTNQKMDSLVVTGDTLISGKSYFKLEATEKHICAAFTRVEYLREEAGKIYRLSSDFVNEYLMIDFQNQVEYTMEFPGDSTYNHVARVDSISQSVFPGGVQVTTQHLTVMDPFDTWGPLFPDFSNLCDPFFRYMEPKCFISGTDTLRLTDRDCHAFKVGTSVNEVAPILIELRPNPAQDHLELPSGYELMMIVDKLGQTQAITKHDQRLDITALSSGLYVLIFKSQKSQGNLATGRFMKL